MATLVGTVLACVSRMTRRRIIEPGMIWALSRRTTRRHFILKRSDRRLTAAALSTVGSFLLGSFCLTTIGDFLSAQEGL